MSMKGRRGNNMGNEDYPEEHFTMPAANVDPHPASEVSVHLVRIVMMILAATVVVFSAAVVIVAWALHSNITDNARKSQLRDKQHTQTEQQLNALAHKVDKSEKNTDGAICTLVIAAIEQSKAQHQPIGIPIFNFASRINCTIPAKLIPPGTPKS